MQLSALEDALARHRLLHVYQFPAGATLATETEALQKRLEALDASRAALHDWASTLTSKALTSKAP